MIYEFDVAISFAGTEREVAGEIARLAKANGLRIFFDEFYTAELWGKDLPEQLGDVYEKRAQYCLVVISRGYCERPYTIHERRTAMLRALESRQEYLLPVVTDDAWPPGLPRSTAYLDLRKMSVAEIVAALVRKVRGEGAPVVLPDEAGPRKINAVHDEALSAQLDRAPSPQSPQSRQTDLTFALVRVSAEASPHWREARPRAAATQSGCAMAFNGDFSGDPWFDVTVWNRSPEPVLLSAVGVQFLSANVEVQIMGGAFAAPEIPLGATFCLELPDLWATLAKATREGKGKPLAIDELASTLLPNPVWLEPRTPYRYALDLFDYQNLVPNRCNARFWARTDRGEHVSDLVHIAYLIPGNYGGIRRYEALVRPEANPGADERNARRRQRIAAQAQRLWDEAGRPEGQDQEIWLRAEREILAEEARGSWTSAGSPSGRDYEFLRDVENQYHRDHDADLQLRKRPL